ncbi:GNAT family N-acetyltransferase [Ethanoligenens sp.]|uniref:GNAT family N-acetyltransferase n=1 Tax=Ethanoligenens sp. TaxID=2099655 RepID=UPI0039ED624A
MNLHLVKVGAADAEEMLRMQRKCFAAHYQRYRDIKSPYKQSIEQMCLRIQYEHGFYYAIVWNKRRVGGLFLIKREHNWYHVGILYVLPMFQGKGLGQAVLAMAEQLHGNVQRWTLDCPKDLPLNRRCYEKSGYRLTGETEVVNGRLTLVYYQKERPV